MRIPTARKAKKCIFYYWSLFPAVAISNSSTKVKVGMYYVCIYNYCYYSISQFTDVCSQVCVISL